MFGTIDEVGEVRTVAALPIKEVKPMNLYQVTLLLLPLLMAATHLATALLEWRARKDEDHG